MKITIITATYNNEDTIEETIKSVASQSYSNIEYIIIDGKSEDKTLEIIERNNNKFKIVSEKDDGIYDALNKGIIHATGDIIGFLHADDIYANNTVIEEVVEKFAQQNTDAVYSDLHYVSKTDITKIIRDWQSGEFNYSKLKKGWMPPHPTLFVKTEIYKQFGNFNTNYKIAADYDLMMRFFGKHKITISYLAKVTIKMRVGGQSNKNIKNILLKMKEDLKVIRTNEIGGFLTLVRKNTSKISQFFK